MVNSVRCKKLHFVICFVFIVEKSAAQLNIPDYYNPNDPNYRQYLNPNDLNPNFIPNNVNNNNPNFNPNLNPTNVNPNYNPKLNPTNPNPNFNRNPNNLDPNYNPNLNPNPNRFQPINPNGNPNVYFAGNNFDNRTYQFGFVDERNDEIYGILDKLDVEASDRCTENVAAQWNFETNVNVETQAEVVSTCFTHLIQFLFFHIYSYLLECKGNMSLIIVKLFINKYH